MKVDARLEDISPKWYKALLGIRSVSGFLKKRHVLIGLSEQTLDASSYASCMVGEAYMFNRNYENSLLEEKCRKCTSLANNFNATWHDNSQRKIAEIERVIVRFCNHVEDDHDLRLR